jgi:D-glycero-D-manno-heptose 1,7-bisphosphate phosphatase
MAGSRAVFLDRDGTINVEVNYLYRPEDLVLVPGVAEAISRLNHAGYTVIVVTNQAGIARGYYGLADLERLHAHLQGLLQSHGAYVDAFFFCPHHPDFTGPCLCRKPAPGMLQDAARAHGVALAQSWMIGDSAPDLVAGQAAGCRTILVRTGYGRRVEEHLHTPGSPRPDAIADALPAAVDYLLEADSLSP